MIFNRKLKKKCCGVYHLKFFNGYKEKKQALRVSDLKGVHLRKEKNEGPELK